MTIYTHARKTTAMRSCFAAIFTFFLLWLRLWYILRLRRVESTRYRCFVTTPTTMTLDERLSPRMQEEHRSEHKAKTQHTKNRTTRDLSFHALSVHPNIFFFLREGGEGSTTKPLLFAHYKESKKHGMKGRKKISQHLARSEALLKILFYHLFLSTLTCLVNAQYLMLVRT